MKETPHQYDAQENSNHKVMIGKGSGRSCYVDLAKLAGNDLTDIDRSGTIPLLKLDMTQLAPELWDMIAENKLTICAMHIAGSINETPLSISLKSPYDGAWHDFTFDANHYR